MSITLNTSQHEKLRGLIQAEQGKAGEMSVRGRIHRAVTKLLEENPEDPLGDLILIRDITGHDPRNQDYKIYDDTLGRLSALMGSRDKLYGGEYEWTMAMLGR